MWRKVLAEACQEADFGIVCLTRDNIYNPWIHFEAGAIFRDFDKPRVIPVVLGQEKVQQPFSDLQVCQADRDGIFRVLERMAEATPDKLARCRKLHERFWEDLERSFERAMEEIVKNPPPPPPQKEILQEVLGHVRELSKRLDMDTSDLSNKAIQGLLESVEKDTAQLLSRMDTVLKLLSKPSGPEPGATRPRRENYPKAISIRSTGDPSDDLRYV